MEQQNNREIDSGLLCLVMLSRLHGTPADPGQLKHQYGEFGSQFIDGRKVYIVLESQIDGIGHVVYSLIQQVTNKPNVG